MPPQARLRQPVACVSCREKKVKCDGQRPCAHCKRHDWECVFPEPSRKRRRLATDPDVSRRLARVEAFLSAQTAEPSFQPENALATPADDQESVLSLGLHSQETLQWTGQTGAHASPTRPAEASPASVRYGPTPSNKKTDAAPFGVLSSNLSAATSTPRECPVSALAAHDSEASESPFDHESGLIEENATHEYHGAGSMFSVFSKLGSQWVIKQTGAAEFESLARSIASHTVSWLKLTDPVPEKRAPEPDRDTALKLSSACFEDNETFFSIVHQHSFELRLKQFFDAPESSPADPGWYALRHTVYACGKRKLLKDASVADFKGVHSSAFPYFANALARHTEMIYYKSSMTAVQALAAMAHYAQAIGAPTIEYALQSNAMRLAQSKALHRKVPHSVGLSQFEIQQRSLLFWSMYVHEKHIAHWSGRPSAIDDDCITCPLPEATSSGDKEKIEYFNHLVRLTQILSSVLKFLSHLRMRGKDPNWLIWRVQHLNAELQTWTESVPPSCRPEPLRKDSSPLNVPLNLILYIRYTYSGLVITLNSSFTHPWLLDWIGHHGNAMFQQQINESTELVTKISRDAIKDTKHINIDFTSPVWLVFYYPLVGLIHLFVHIVKSPEAPTVQLDLALLDIICGHFARLKYTTSSTMSFPFVKELCRFAEHAVDLKSTESSRIANDAGTMAESAAQLKYSTQGTVPGSDARDAANNVTDVSETLYFDFLDADLNYQPLYPTYGDEFFL